MATTNWERWQTYMGGVASPQNYIDWGFIYLIAASLQRRVWCPPEHRPVFPNIYVTLVGKPGIGKGQVIRPVGEILSHFKMENQTKPIGKTPEEQTLIDAMYQSQMAGIEKEKEDGEEPLVIPVAADAVTYEALVRSMTKCVRRINYTKIMEDGTKKLAVHSHSSLCFNLEEIASLFRKNTESLVNFLIQAYDCGDNYEYVTKTQGKDRIRRLCLNFFGGTNPDFMQDTFDDKLLSQGYSSRTFYIYAARNRKSVFFLPELTPEQKKAKEEILAHVEKLTQLYGQIQIDPATFTWLENWWKEFNDDPTRRASQSLQLDAYYARRNIHTMKIAMAMHFMESTDMYIPLSTFQRADKFLADEEKTMHLAIVLEGNNPLAGISRKVIQFLATAGPQPQIDILQELWGQTDNESLTKVLSYLIETKQLRSKSKDEEGEKVTRFEVVKSE